MYLDGALQFTGTAGVAGSTDSPTTGTQHSTNIIDLVNARDMGVGDDPSLKLLVQVTTAFTSGTSLQVSISGAPDDGTGNPGTYTIYAYGPIVAEASLVAGRRLFDIDLPRKTDTAALPRFLRLDYITVGTHVAGALFGAVVLDRQDAVIYPPGITIAN